MGGRLSTAHPARSPAARKPSAMLRRCRPMHPPCVAAPSCRCSLTPWLTPPQCARGGCRSTAPPTGPCCRVREAWQDGGKEGQGAGQGVVSRNGPQRHSASTGARAIANTWQPGRQAARQAGTRCCSGYLGTHPRRAMAMTTSSRLALPARSPMPLMVHSIWRAPPSAPASELAVDRPRSFWQWVEMMTFSAPGVLALILAIRPCGEGAHGGAGAGDWQRVSVCGSGRGAAPSLHGCPQRLPPACPSVPAPSSSELHHPATHLELVGKVPPRGVGDVECGGPRLDHLSQDVVQEGELGAACRRRRQHGNGGKMIYELR